MKTETTLDAFLKKEGVVEKTSNQGAETSPPLPEGWEWVKLKDICKISAGGTPRRSVREYWNGNIPWVKISDIPDSGLVFETEEKITQKGLENSSAKLFPEGTILFSIFATIGKVGVLCIDAATNQAIAGVHVQKDNVDTKYLFYCLRQFGISLLNVGRGAAQHNVNQTILKSLRIPLPPLDVQRRIVARIEKLFGEITKIRNLRQQTEEETNLLFSNTLRKAWSDKSNWKVEPLRKLTTIVSGQVDPTIEPYASLPHISGDCIESGTCRLLKFRQAKEDRVKSNKYHFRQNAILYSKIRPYLKKAVQAPFEGICSADVYAFDIISQNIEPRFLMYSLIAPDFCEYANKMSERTRIPKINREQLLAFRMGYPSLKRQQQIVAMLDTLQTKAYNLRKLQAETLTETEHLTQAVLKMAFSGKP